MSEVPGTTRDAIDTTIPWGRSEIVLIDTAGIRRRGKVASGPAAERYSTLRALKAISRADVAVLVLDAADGLTAQDAHVAGYVVEEGAGSSSPSTSGTSSRRTTARSTSSWPRSAANCRSSSTRRSCRSARRPASACRRCWSSRSTCWGERRQRISTGELNRLVGAAVDRQPPPLVRGRRPKIRYATQVAVAPPTFVLFSTDAARGPLLVPPLPREPAPRRIRVRRHADPPRVPRGTRAAAARSGPGRRASPLTSPDAHDHRRRTAGDPRAHPPRLQRARRGGDPRGLHRRRGVRRAGGRTRAARATRAGRRSGRRSSSVSRASPISGTRTTGASLWATAAYPNGRSAAIGRRRGDRGPRLRPAGSSRARRCAARTRTGNAWIRDRGPAARRGRRRGGVGHDPGAPAGAARAGDAPRALGGHGGPDLARPVATSPACRASTCPRRLVATAEPSALVDRADLVLFAVPSSHLRSEVGARRGVCRRRRRTSSRSTKGLEAERSCG